MLQPQIIWSRIDCFMAQPIALASAFGYLIDLYMNTHIKLKGAGYTYPPVRREEGEGEVVHDSIRMCALVRVDLHADTEAL